MDRTCAIRIYTEDAQNGLNALETAFYLGCRHDLRELPQRQVFENNQKAGDGGRRTKTPHLVEIPFYVYSSTEYFVYRNAYAA